MCVMIKENGDLLMGKWVDFEIFMFVCDYKGCYVLIFLMFDVVVRVFDELDVKGEIIILIIIGFG